MRKSEVRSPKSGWSLVLLLALMLTACARPDDAWNRVQETGVLRVGMDASFPPFESIAADGTLVGFDVDLARELAARMGVEAQFVANLPYDGLYDALAAKRVDAVISALVVSPDRMADFAYSTVYFDAGQVLVVREGTADVAGMADLEERTLAAEFGTPGDVEARAWARRLPDLTVLPCQTAAGAIEALALGEADGALVDHVSALAATARLRPWPEGLRPEGSPKSGESRGLTIVGEPVTDEPYAVVVRRESRTLLRAINATLAEMVADRTVEALVAKWLREQ